MFVKKPMDDSKYLTGIPQEVEEFGLCKTLLVRREVIDLKHIMTEIFVRKTIDASKLLGVIGYDLFMYMECLTGRLRRIHHFSRDYQRNFDQIVKTADNSFFPKVDLYSGLDVIIALDFDGTVTKNSFEPLYRLCIDRGKVVIVTANPTVTDEWFDKRGYDRPAAIHACKGKVNKLKRLIELQKKHDIVFFVDNEPEYLQIAWLFGIKTFHFVDNKIKYFTMKTK